MSRAESVVRMCRSSLGAAAPQALAYAAERACQAASSSGVLGTYSGRSGPKYPGSQDSAGLLDPTPRGSKPIQS